MISGIDRGVIGFGVVCGIKVDRLWSSDGWGSMEGGGSRECSTGNPRSGDRWPGVFSLKTISLEKWYFPAMSRTRHPVLFSSYPTKIASYRRGPPFVRSSGGMDGKHWHPHTRRCERSGLEPCIIS